MQDDKLKCPLCGETGTKALMGPFPVKFCSNPECSCLWGAWAGIAVWFYDRLAPPEEDGWMLLAYEGGYARALWTSLRGDGA